MWGLAVSLDPSFLIKVLFIYFWRDGGREGDREGGKHQCVVASHVPPTGDLARNPGMCLVGESNQRPFGSQASIQSTEPHLPGPQPLLQLLGFPLSLVGIVVSSVSQGHPSACPFLRFELSTWSRAFSW